MSQNESPWKSISVVTFIGFDIAVCTVIGFWIGNQVDVWLGTSPIGLIIGVLLGVTAGVLCMIPIVNKYL